MLLTEPGVRLPSWSFWPLREARRRILSGMEERTDVEPDTYQPSVGVLHALAGVSLLVVGFWFRSNTNEGLYFFGTLATIFTFSGLYCVGAGAVARGIQIARR